MGKLLATALVVVLAGCQSRDAGDDEELRSLRDEVSELRSELREIREELRDIRSEQRALRDETGGAAAIEPLPGEPAPIPKEPKGAEEGGGEPPGRAGEPAPQEKVKIAVTSNPSGATVFIGSTKLGVTPLLLERRPSASELHIRIEKPGYRPRLQTVRPEEDTKVSVQLAKK